MYQIEWKDSRAQVFEEFLVSRVGNCDEIQLHILRFAMDGVVEEGRGENVMENVFLPEFVAKKFDEVDDGIQDFLILGGDVGERPEDDLSQLSPLPHALPIVSEEIVPQLSMFDRFDNFFVVAFTQMLKHLLSC